jgi:hypothetical protein
LGNNKSRIACSSWRSKLAVDRGGTRHLFQNYKQLQFFDTLALYFNRTHAGERGELKFDHVPLNEREDVTITVRPAGDGVYSLSPYPFAAENASFAYAGRPIAPGQHRIAAAAGPARWRRRRRCGKPSDSSLPEPDHAGEHSRGAGRASSFS